MAFAPKNSTCLSWGGAFTARASPQPHQAVSLSKFETLPLLGNVQETAGMHAQCLERSVAAIVAITGRRPRHKEEQCAPQDQRHLPSTNGMLCAAIASNAWDFAGTTCNTTTSQVPVMLREDWRLQEGCRHLEQAGNARPDSGHIRIQRVVPQQHPHRARDRRKADHVRDEQPEARAAEHALVKGVVLLQLVPACMRQADINKPPSPADSQ